MRFTINDDNKGQAYTYISSKLKSDSFYLYHLDDIRQETVANEELRVLFKGGQMDAEALDTWCHKYLTDKQFSALRAALRKRQSRRGSNNINVELGRSTYADLNDLAAAESMNIKDYLAMLIEDKHKESTRR